MEYTPKETKPQEFHFQIGTIRRRRLVAVNTLNTHVINQLRIVSMIYPLKQSTISTLSIFIVPLIKLEYTP